MKTKTTKTFVPSSKIFSLDFISSPWKTYVFHEFLTPHVKKLEKELGLQEFIVVSSFIFKLQQPITNRRKHVSSVEATIFFPKIEKPITPFVWNPELIIRSLKKVSHHHFFVVFLHDAARTLSGGRWTVLQIVPGGCLLAQKGVRIRGKVCDFLLEGSDERREVFCGVIFLWFKEGEYVIVWFVPLWGLKWLITILCKFILLWLFSWPLWCHTFLHWIRLEKRWREWRSGVMRERRVRKGLYRVEGREKVVEFVVK